jgi:hypothetical protein
MDEYSKYTQSPDPNPQPKKKPWDRRKIRKISSVSAGILVVLGLSGWLWSRRMPSPSASPKTLVQFIATERFANLPPDQQQPYLDALDKVPWSERRQVFQQANLSEEERHAAFENTMGRQFEKRMDEFFALPAGPQRDAYLDRIIDQMESRRQRATTRQAAAGNTPNANHSQAGQGPGQGHRGGRGGGNNPARMKNRIERSSPEMRTKFAEFHAALRARRAQRGL